MFKKSDARLRGVAWRAAAFLGCVLPLPSLPGSAFAAGASLAPPGLRSAVESAWIRHPAAEATEATLNAAEARTEAASQPLYNPELGIDADDEGPDRTFTAGIGLTLDVSGKRRARAAAAQSGLDAATVEARLRRRDFAQAWLEAWAATNAAERRVELGVQRVALITRFADLAERQFQAGDISSLDRDLALLARDEAGAEQAVLLAESASAREALNRLNVGAPPALRPAFPDGAALPAAGGPVPDVESLPEWILAQASAEATAARVKVAERDRIADPTVVLRGGSTELADGVRDEVYGVSVSVPLFVRNSFRAELLAAKADARAAAADLERVRLELQARAERAAAAHGAVRNAWQQWQRSPGTNVESRATLLERLWRAGELSTADYLLQLDQTLDTALVGAELEGRLWTSCTEYLVATGQLEAWLGFETQRSE